MGSSRGRGTHARRFQKLDVPKIEFMADAQLFSFRAFQNEGRRNQFLDYVRAELER